MDAWQIIQLARGFIYLVVREDEQYWSSVSFVYSLTPAFIFQQLSKRLAEQSLG